MTFKGLLEFQMDSAWKFLERAVEGIDDDMLHWEPAPGCWGLRDNAGRWCLDFYVPNPLPPGPKTVGWLMAHLATCKEMHYDILFGSGRKDWEKLDLPGGADDMRRYLNEVHFPLRKKLEQLDIKSLEKPVPHRSDDSKTIPLWQIICFDIYHDYEHGGQIFQVKNEYMSRCGLYA